MTLHARRNACPTIARPMATGDGLLARLPPSGPLTAASLRAVTLAAERFGNGIVEVTARGSLQVRGLSAASAGPFAAALAEAGFVDAAPAILAPPLAGFDPAERLDVRPFTHALRAAIEADGTGPRLAPKTSVVIDGGGRLHLDAIDADIRLVATDDNRFLLALGGNAATGKPVGTVPRDRGVEATRTALALLAAAGPGARGRDLDPAAVAVAIGAAPASAPSRRPPAEPITALSLADGTCTVGVGLAFGQAEAPALAALVDSAEARGARLFAPAEGRALLAIGLAAEAVPAVRDGAARAGFIVRADDPRRSIVACAGAPACAAALMPARTVAAAVAEAATPLLDGSVVVHLSGCQKGCAHPRPAPLAFVGAAGGVDLVVDGRAGDAPLATVAAATLPAAMARLAAVVAGARRPDETAAAAIARIGRASLAATALPEPADA